MIHPNPYHDLRFIVELFYSLIVFTVFIFIYFKTKEMYSLTNHKGIKYLRRSFLFLGLTYLIGFLLAIIKLGLIFSDDPQIKGQFFPISIILVGYLSTIAIAYLAYSTDWKRIKEKNFIIFSNLFALITSIIAFITRSPILIALTQTILLIYVIINGSKKKNTRILYFSIVLIWIINLLVLELKQGPFFEIRSLLQIISLVVFGFLIRKVMKWTK